MIDYMMITFSTYKRNLIKQLLSNLLNNKMSNQEIILLKTRHKIQMYLHQNKTKHLIKTQAVNRIKLQNKLIPPQQIQIKPKNK